MRRRWKGHTVNSREVRAIRAEIRAPEDKPGLFEAVVMRYGTVDDYDTVFDPGVFAKSLETRLPRLTWGHNWAELIGRVVDYKDTDETLTVVGQLSDFDAVPRARQAYAQMLDGTIDNFSVGFRRNSTREVDGRTHFTESTLDEVALVLAGAVPDTELVAVRSIGLPVSRRRVDETLVIDLGKQVAAGSLTHAEALAALDLAAGVDLSGMAPHVEPEGDDGSEPPDPALAEADAVAEAFGFGA